MSKTNRDRKAAQATAARVVAVQDRRRSGAAGAHADRRLKRERTRATARSRALADW